MKFSYFLCFNIVFYFSIQFNLLLIQYSINYLFDFKHNLNFMSTTKSFFDFTSKVFVSLDQFYEQINYIGQNYRTRI